MVFPFGKNNNLFAVLVYGVSGGGGMVFWPLLEKCL
jgi:hypothetical protein